MHGPSLPSQADRGWGSLYENHWELVNKSTDEVQCCSRVGCVNGHSEKASVCLQDIRGGRVRRAGSRTVWNLSGEYSVFDLLGANVECDLATQSPAL